MLFPTAALQFALVLFAKVQAIEPFPGIIGHDQVKYIPENVPANSDQYRFQPLLTIGEGCDIYPAVDAMGQVSGGLAITGAVNGQCSGSIGQTYVRVGTYGGLKAIMYAWFFPKKQETVFFANKGHRYQWYNAVVWLEETSFDSKAIRLSISDENVEYSRAQFAWPKVIGTSHPQLRKEYSTLDWAYGK